MTQDKYMIGDIEVAMRKANPLSEAEYPIPELNNHSVVYKKGSVIEKGYMPLPVDIERIQDIAIPLRDGTTVYGDLYRKQGEGPVPVILVYTMYSKQGGNFNKNFTVCNTGFPKNQVSGLQCFESPDPAYWCQYGYAICIVDQRGIDHSGGNLVFMGKQAGEDVYDVIEFLAEQDFCSGKVTMMGNSQLAMIQWTAAEAKPPHLAAIAPFEGLRDEYRDCVCRGGIPNTVFHDTDIIAYLYGNNQFEDVSTMLKKYPLMNEYWDDKIAKLSDITIPAYVVASWTHSIHTKNSINGFRELGSTDKWLRIHNTHEWGDLDTKENADDLRKFFDHFLKGIDNGWEKTPHVRYAVLDFNAATDVFRSSDTYPAVQTDTKMLYLDASNGTMSQECPKQTSAAQYDGRSDSVKECVRFEYKITEEMEIHGASNIRVWMSTDKYFWDEEEGLACDTWNTELTIQDDYRGINANMHTVEAFLAVADATGDLRYRERAKRIIDRVIQWASLNGDKFPEHFTKEWKPDLDCNKDRPDDPFKPYGATPGHGIEWSRLISQWAMASNSISDQERKEYIDAAERLYNRAISDAWEADGAQGIVYTTDWEGKPVVHDRMHWTLAEAINSSAVLYRITKNKKYFVDYANFMKYLDEKVIDHVNGSWFHQLDQNNNLLDTVWPGKSDLYHAFQATLIPYMPVNVSVAAAVRKNQMDVVALGELLVDFTENGESENGNPLLEANPGGAPCNVLAMLRKYGKEVGFIGKVGQDQFGQMLKKTLTEVGIHTDGLVMDDTCNTTLT